MSAALRTTQATPSMRPLGAAFGGIVTAAAIVGVLAFSQLATTKSQAVPATGTAPVTHDHGWSFAAAASAPVLHDRGLATDPSAAAGPAAESGGSRSSGSNGSNGTRFRK